MNRYEELKRHIDDFDKVAEICGAVGATIRDVCPLDFCSGFTEGRKTMIEACEYCPTGWQWALRAEMKEDKS